MWENYRYNLQEPENKFESCEFVENAREMVDLLVYFWP